MTWKIWYYLRSKCQGQLCCTNVWHPGSLHALQNPSLRTHLNFLRIGLCYIMLVDLHYKGLPYILGLPKHVPRVIANVLRHKGLSWLYFAKLKDINPPSNWYKVISEDLVGIPCRILLIDNNGTNKRSCKNVSGMATLHA